MFQPTQINAKLDSPKFRATKLSKIKKYRASIVRTCSNLFYSLEVFIHTGSCKSKTRIGSVNADSNAIWKPIWKWRQSQPKYIWQLTVLSMSHHEYTSWVIILKKLLFFVDDITQRTIVTQTKYGTCISLVSPVLCLIWRGLGTDCASLPHYRCVSLTLFGKRFWKGI